MEDKKYRDWIRRLPCVICGNDIETQACHVRCSDARFAKTNAMGVRDDLYMVPMCGECHLGPGGQHDMGEERFWGKHNIDAPKLARAFRELYESSKGDIGKGEDLCYEVFLWGYA